MLSEQAFEMADKYINVKIDKYQFRETAKSFVYYSHKYYLLMDYLKCMLEGKSTQNMC